MHKNLLPEIISGWPLFISQNLVKRAKCISNFELAMIALKRYRLPDVPHNYLQNAWRFLK